MPKLKETPDWLRADIKTQHIGVDRENKVIRGFIVAEEGPFRSEGRGEFDSDAIKQLATLMSKERDGLKSRFTHPTLSNDGLGKFLGRAKEPRLDIAMRDGQPRSILRADLHLSETAFEGNPNGNLGEYLLDLAEEDPDAMGASLVLQVDEEYRLDEKGVRKKDETGNYLPPLWRPKRLHAIDVVDTGDATRAFLSTDNLPDSVVRQATALMKEQFAGCSEEVIRARVLAWLDKFLDLEIKDGTILASPKDIDWHKATSRQLRRKHKV